MKKIPLCIALFLTVLFTTGAQNTVDMDTALRQAADFFYGKIKPEGRKIAVFDLKSDNPEDGETFAERLRGIFSNDGRLVCIERGDMLKLIHGEQAYNLTTNVDDSAQIRMGHELGAEVILSGTLLKKEYGFLVTINAIDTETAARLGQYENRIELSLTEKIRNYYRENGFLFVGLRAGLGTSAYTPGSNALPNSYSGGKTEINTVKNDFEFALQASIAPLRFFAVQAEFMLASDSYSIEYTPPMRSRETVRKVTYTSLLTPILGKLMFKPRVGNLNLLIQGYGGIYFAIPLTPVEASGSAGSFSGNLTAPFGFVAGGGAGIKLGPGFVFLDARYMADSADTQVTGVGKINKRQRFSFSAGYEIKLF